MLLALVGCSDFVLKPDDSDPIADTDVGIDDTDSETDVDPDTDDTSDRPWVPPGRICHDDGTIRVEDGLSMTREEPFDADSFADMNFLFSVVPGESEGKPAVWAATVQGDEVGDREWSGAWLLSLDEWTPTLVPGPPALVIDDWGPSVWMSTIGANLTISESDGTGVAFILTELSLGGYGWSESSTRPGDVRISVFDRSPTTTTGATEADAFIDPDFSSWAAQPRWADFDGDGLQDLFVATGLAGRAWMAPISGSLTAADATTQYTLEPEAMDPRYDRATDVHDINGDGHPDLVVGGVGGNDLHVFFGPMAERTDWSWGDIVYRSENTGSGPGLGGLTYGLHPAEYGYPFADFTGDGEGDLMFGACERQQAGRFDQASVAWNHEPGTYEPGEADWVLSQVDDDTHVVEGIMNVGDVNGDGIPDVWAGHTGGQPGTTDFLLVGPIDGDRLFGGDVSERVVTFEYPTASRDTYVFPAGDLDADGIDDIAMAWGAWGEATRDARPMAMILFRGCEEW